MADFLVADDLSGALDAAGAFHRAGDDVTVVLAREAWTATTPGSLVAFTTETRNASAPEAASAVRAAIAHGHALGGRMGYKKIDSTLRGQVAAELAAMREALGGRRILFAPANPVVGRTVESGLLRVRGVPVSETEFARDPMSPVRTSHLATLLGLAGEGVQMPDTRDAADLARAVAGMEARGDDWVGVGSGALAVPVAARRGLQRRAGETPWVNPAAGGPAVFLCGSAHPGNHEQVRRLERERGVAACEWRRGRPGEAATAASAHLRAGRSVALSVEAERGDSASVLRAFVATVSEVLAATPAERLFVTGGETAFALCRALGITWLSFRAEIEPGLCLASAITPIGPRWFAIKPGGFGDALTWVRAYDALQVVDVRRA